MRTEEMREQEDMVERLMGDYRPLIYALARRMHPRDPLDEDLLQCGMIGLWRAAESWDGSRPFGPLARRYIQGEMADYLRRRRKEPRTVPLEGLEEVLAAEDDYSGLELADAIGRAVPPSTRRGQLLRALAEGDSLSHAAKALGLRPARARAMARRCLRQMTERSEG